VRNRADGRINGGVHIERFSEAEAEAFVARTCFKTGPPRLLGVELEWLVRDVAGPAAVVTGERLDAALAAVPDLRAGHITVEPGGQVELSTFPRSGLTSCVAAAADDIAALRRSLAGHGLALVGDGLDPSRAPTRILDLPRYAAMEAFFDREGPEGRVMMCSTASVQVCVDAGDEAGGGQPTPWSRSASASQAPPRLAAPSFRERWRLLHALAPILIATFANSPFAGGRPSGWRCTRQAVWSRLDPSRTRAAFQPSGDQDPRAAWVRYALDARVLCVRDAAGEERADWTAPPGLTFAQWLRGDGPRPVTVDDLAYHLGTLFPPVRARGHLEVRYVDAQPGNDWMVVPAVLAALLDDAAAADRAAAAAEPLCHDPAATIRAARDGLADPRLAKSARICFDAALGALDRIGGAALRPAVEGFAERYVDRGRCPADERLDRWRRTGVVHVQEAVSC
jgi:ergothioneine biosynthesis glutamate--cysteine ligase EgtA